ncbi:hypothetical protein HPB50_008263 [Hyalomma asiaticum]|uniref:Uncharacterized protein n=1 Tax=Hyalomma asiaticum TaxID=266040 RepID=A0ACB7RQ99_HYAAI|nr:hypothetical protein HPB50_008263 [Hyalomma asiaticum]
MRTSLSLFLVFLFSLWYLWKYLTPLREISVMAGSVWVALWVSYKLAALVSNAFVTSVCGEGKAVLITGKYTILLISIVDSTAERNASCFCLLVVEPFLGFNKDDRVGDNGVLLRLLTTFPNLISPKELLGSALAGDGCDTGFGHRLAKRLSRKGFLVFAGCLSSRSKGAEELKLLPNINVLQLDVTDQKQIDDALDAVKEELGSRVLWSVVANAGIGTGGFLEWLSTETVAKVFDVNVLGVLRVIKKFLPLVKKCRGRVVTLASPLGHFTIPMVAPYCMTKHAVVSMMDAFRRECHLKGVDMVTVEPSAYRTSIVAMYSLPKDHVMRELRKQAPEVIADYSEQEVDDALTMMGKFTDLFIRDDPEECVDILERAITETKPKTHYHSPWGLDRLYPFLIMSIPSECFCGFTGSCGITSPCFIFAGTVIGSVCIAATLSYVLSRLFWKYAFVTRISGDGKAVLITGCDTGFGHRLAKRLSHQGFLVFAGCLSSTSDGAMQLRTLSNIEVLQLDVTKQEQVDDAFHAVKEHLGSKELWSVVANAGILMSGLLEWLSTDTIVNVFDVNVFGVLRVTKRFLPLLKKSKGRVVTVASPLGHFTLPMMGPYCMTKHATVSMMDALRRECDGKDVDVVTVEPPSYRTAIYAMISTKDAVMRELEKQSPEVAAEYSREEVEQWTRTTAGIFEAGVREDPEGAVDLIEQAVRETFPKACYGSSWSLGQLYVSFMSLLPREAADVIVSITRQVQLSTRWKDFKCLRMQVKH